MTAKDIYAGQYSRTLWIDFETRSALDLKTVGAHKYNMDATTEVLLCAYAFDNDPVRVVEADEIPDEVLDAIEDETVLKIAHNAEFDISVAKYVLQLEISLTDWYDTMCAALYYGYPAKLAELANVLKTTRKASQEEMYFFSIPIPPELKRNTSDANREYNRLIKLFPPKWNDPKDHPEKWVAFKRYAAGDVEVMRECAAKMRILPVIEIEAIHETFLMNFNGMPFDTELAKRIMELVNTYQSEAEEEALRVYDIKNLRSGDQVISVLLREGVDVPKDPKTGKPTLNSKMRGSLSHPLLDLRDIAAGSAFSKLPKAFERLCADGRLRGEFMYYGAHTGRWSSRGVQLQNWARILSEVDEKLENIRNYDHLRQHLRLCLGHDPLLSFTCADLSQIEARIVAYLAGCKWLCDVFAAGGDPYSSTALKMFGGSLDPHTGRHPKRQYGKAAVLGFGFGGSGKAIERIDKPFYDQIGAVAAQELCDMYREAHPEIKALWYKLMNGWNDAMKGGIAKIPCGGVTIIFQFDGNTMRIQLPSGRALYYRHVRKTPSERFGYEIVYANYGDGHITWEKIWHGTIIENIVQAIARDIVFEAMLRAQRRVPEAQVIMSVHDEAGFLHPPHVKMLDVLLEEMARPVEWAKGLVTAGEGFTSDRYRK